MHATSIERFRHEHDHYANTTARSESRTRWVAAITSAMMIGELAVGSLTHSMALTADGWHMATHAGALGLSALAYWFARTRARERAFSFGTGKVYALAGYTSAIVLGVVALLMMLESVRRLGQPLPIAFGEALPVAVLGLLVNLLSAALLEGSHDHAPTRSGAGPHEHPHPHPDGHERPAHDHNLRAAYLHVVADAFTSVLAIAALLAGRYAGVLWLDPLMGVVGGLVILKWGASLCRDAGRQLLDALPSPEVADAIRKRIEEVDDVRVTDLHVWELAPGRHGCIVSLVTGNPRDAVFYREVILSEFPAAHLTVEVQRCPDHDVDVDCAGA